MEGISVVAVHPTDRRGGNAPGFDSPARAWKWRPQNELPAVIQVMAARMDHEEKAKAMAEVGRMMSSGLAQIKEAMKELDAMENSADGENVRSNE